MTAYVVVFAFSILSFYYAESKQHRGESATIAVIIAIALPCLLAAFRHESIGTDVRVYASPLFRMACVSDSFFEYWNFEQYNDYYGNYVAVKEFEIGFVLLTYIIAKLFKSFPVLLFAIQALTIIPIYKGLRAFSNTQPVWLGMCVYYLMFFNQTMNMMRQWISMAFLLYGFQFLRDHQYRKYFLTALVGMLFHNSTLLGLIIFVVYRLVAVENAYNLKLKLFLLLAMGIIGMLSLDVLVVAMELLGLRYGNYFSGSLQLMPYQVLYRLPLLLLFAIRWKYLKRANRHASFFVVMIAYDLLASQLTSIFAHSARIAVFFNEYYMLAYSGICVASNSKKNRQAMRLFVISYLCFYWWYLYVFKGSSSTVPYMSIWS